MTFRQYVRKVLRLNIVSVHISPNMPGHILEGTQQTVIRKASEILRRYIRFLFRCLFVNVNQPCHCLSTFAVAIVPLCLITVNSEKLPPPHYYDVYDDFIVQRGN